MLKLQENQILNIFNYFAPQDGYIGIVSIPHSGEIIPSEFSPFLTSDQKAQNQDVDYKVHELVDIKKLTENGIAVIVYHIHRICVDLNRAEDICILNWKKNSHGKELVIKEPSQSTIDLLTQKYYAPYYEMMKALIHELHLHHKKEISFIDLHSMPSKPTEYHLAINPNQKMSRPAFCVSDIEGKSCAKEFIDYTCDLLRKFEKDVTQNDPYFGGHITRHVHATFERINNIQIEINRGIYMDEESRSLIPELVSPLKLNLTNALIDIFQKFKS